MKVLITTFGTRGDIQPFIALGIGLQQAGHQVGICTPAGYESFVKEHGLTYLHMDNDLLELTQAALKGDIFGSIRKIVPAMRRSMDNEWQAALNFQPDLIIYHPKCLGSFHVAEKLNIPAMVSLPLPFYTPTSEFPVPFFPDFRLGGGFNRFSYRLMGLASGMYGGTVNDLRTKTLEMPAIGRFSNLLVRSDGSPVPVLYPYSQHLLPVPKDFPAHVHVTGYWFLDHASDWQPDPNLVRFLDAGKPPVYVGFGSIGAWGGEKRAKVVIEALQKSGQRGVLASGWGGVSAADLPQDIFMVESVPHDWLFPQVAAVVHHGGAGTTAAGLRAGKPSIICPFMADQPFWGRLVYQRGVGPKPMGQGRLTADRLAEAIATVTTDQTMQQRAAELGTLIRAEDGIACAVEVIQTTVGETA